MKNRFTFYDEAKLISKLIMGISSKEENERVSILLDEHPRLKEEIKGLSKDDSLSKSFDKYNRYSPKKGFDKFVELTSSKGHKKHYQKTTSYFKYSIAAMALLAVGIFSLVVLYNSFDTTTIIGPGEQKGLLVLTNGEQIGIEKNDVNIIDEDINISYKEGILTYSPAIKIPIENRKNADESDTEYNKFIIPYGGENSVRLSDGSLIHLNSGSKLIYPISFKGNKRMVILEGEAFFDIAQDEKCPFVVRTKYGEITVLGTAFNVNAYDDAGACYTTLVRGKVMISTLMETSKELLPGDQGIITMDKIEKRKVNIEDYAGWINGIYSFNDKSLGEIMRTLKRWYNVEVVFEDPSIISLRYTGHVKRYQTINSFLDAFEMTGDIKYKIENHKIYLYKNLQE